MERTLPNALLFMFLRREAGQPGYKQDRWDEINYD